jgi:hypothetical protein
MKFPTIIIGLCLLLTVCSASIFTDIVEAGIEEFKENVQLEEDKALLKLEEVFHQVAHIGKVLDVFRLNPFTLSPSQDIYKTHVEMILEKGFQYEEHKIVTKDRYILTAWRITKNVKKSIPVVLQHGLLDSSFTWILNSDKESLPFLLADLGYDVWLTNNRGNKYSNEHLDLNSDKGKNSLYYSRNSSF